VQVAGYPYDPKKAADTSFAGASNFLIANNTITYQNNGPGILLWKADSISHTIINNILYENAQNYPSGAGAQGIVLYHAGGGHVIQNNLLYATEPGGVDAIGGTAGWQGKYSESGNIVNTVNPRFIDAPAALTEAPNFHLQDWSPAIDMGVILSEVPVDMAGGVRPSGSAHDAGAFEFGAMPEGSKTYTPSPHAH
jgi:hypothetical protein